MYDFLVKRGEMLAFALGIVLVLIFLMTALPNLDQFNALPEDQRNTSGIFDIGLSLGIGLFAITALAAVIFGLVQFVTNPKGSLKVLGGLVILAITFGIFYAMADPGTTGALASTIEDFKISDNVSKLISAGINTAISLSAVSVAMFFFGELYNAFK